MLFESHFISATYELLHNEKAYLCGIKCMKKHEMLFKNECGNFNWILN
jgi:hypothetical protein